MIMFPSKQKTTGKVQIWKQIGESHEVPFVEIGV